MSAVNGHALHLDEPCRTADWGESDDAWCPGESLCEHPSDNGIIGHIAEIDYDVGHIAECHAAFCQQSPDILPHPLRLPHYVAGMDHTPLVVDARCARDVYVAAVAIFYQCATLESHSVVNSAVEVAEG